MPRTGLSADQLKEKAIDAALALMRHVGHDKVRLSDVARDIGVSHAALYPHFADKAALFDAVIERWLRETVTAAAAVARQAGDPRARIVEWFVAIYRLKRARALNDPEPFRAFDLAAALDKPFVGAHLEGLMTQLQGLIIESGSELGLADAGEKADLLFRATTAFHHPTLVARTAHEDQEPQLRAIVMLLLRAMKSTPPPDGGDARRTDPAADSRDARGRRR